MDFDLPPEDRDRSPLTGFTRAHWEAAADGLLEAVRPMATPKHALLHLPGGRPSRQGSHSDGLEGYARTFLAAAFRLAGAGGEAPGDLASRYADGLAAGTDPASDEAWPAIEPTSQPMVEAASIAIGLFETRPWIWDPLPDRVKQRVVDWLSGSLGKPHWPNNWQLFQVMVNAFLASVGAPHRPEEVRRNLDRIDSYYRRDGWYSDGPGQSYDHYVGWAIHLYTILWCRMGGDEEDPARAARYRERLRRFLADFAHLFAADGAPLHQGRSLIYRFAATAAPWAGALADATPLPPGETRRMASGCLRHFLERGAARTGTLRMGWYDEFLPMAQPYSGPGSPYWASKGFLGLLLPAEHPVWTATEAPLPVERGDFCRALAEPGFLVRGTRADGIVRVANHKSDHYPSAAMGRDAGDDPHYRKLGYSTHTAPEISPEIGGEADSLDADAQVSLVSPDGVSTSRRARIHSIAVVDRFGASCFYPGEGVVADGRAFPLWLERVETVSIARGAAEIRVHFASTLGAKHLRDGGCAVAGAEPPGAETGDGWALVRRADGLASFAAGLAGFGDAAVVRGVGSNAYGPHSAFPVLTSTEPISVEGVAVSLHVLTGAPFDPAAALAGIERVDIRGRCVTVACADGEHFFVQGVAPDEVELELAGEALRGPVRFARVSPDGSRFVWCG
ncbi:MAG: DUF2264 domain-containing protein [Proteobacteria bacterium]|nr:DUF2264 domain-containing protein [Pseudomonadota bacterium]